MTRFWSIPVRQSDDDDDRVLLAAMPKGLRQSDELVLRQAKIKLCRVVSDVTCNCTRLSQRMHTLVETAS